jgi:PAS domain S-box-containing protein
MVATLPLPCVLLDEDNTIIMANEAAESALSTGATNLVGAAFEDLVEESRSGPECGARMLARTRATGSGKQKCLLRGPAESTFTAEISMSSGAPRNDYLLCVIRDLVDLETAEQDLSAAQGRFEQVEAIAGIGHWWRDLSTRSFEWSEGTYQILGADPTISHDVKDVMEHVFHPDDVNAIVSTYQTCLETGAAFDMEHRLVLPDGSIRWVHCRAETAFDDEGNPLSCIGTIVDITARKAFEERLRVSEERFALAMEGANDGVWDWNLLTDDVYFSPSWFSMLGFDPSEWPPRLETWAQLVHPDDKKRVLAQVKAYLDDEADSFESEMRIRHKNGRHVHILARALKVKDASGTLRRLVGTHVDLSERKRYEEHLRESQKLEAVGRLVGGIAHDFNNVLGAIQGNVHLASQNAEGRTLKKLNTIDQLVTRAAQMVGHLLTFARRDSAERSVFSLTESLREGYNLSGSVVPENVNHETLFTNDLLPIRGNAIQVQQVLMNLLSNAVDAVAGSPEPRIHCTVSRYDADDAFLAQHTETTARSFACIRVEDNGTGIAAEDADKIFEPFFTTKEVGHGTGLGLATAFGAVRSHGGCFAVGDVDGGGAYFEVYFPLSDEQVLSSPITGRTLTRGNGETLLLVDDDRDVREVTGSVLRGLGYHVVEASNGVQALTHFEEGNERIDLVVSDVVMPQMGGIVLRNAVQSMLPTLPFILATGYDQAEVLRSSTGSDIETLNKPFDLQRLTALIAELLSKRASCD